MARQDRRAKAAAANATEASNRMLVILSASVVAAVLMVQLLP